MRRARIAVASLDDAGHVKQWFTPKPWIITDCEIDLRPGGLFRTRMPSPDGSHVSDRHCCYLEIVLNERPGVDGRAATGLPAVRGALHHRG